MAQIPFFTHAGLDHFIGADAGEVRLGGKVLPGLLQSLVLRSTLRVDAAAMVSGAERTQPLGYGAPTVWVVLALATEAPGFFSGFIGAADAEGDHTCYGKARLLEALHRSVDEDGNPVKYRLTNIHANARGIREVWFAGLTTSEAHDDVIRATLELTQVETESFESLSRAAASAFTEEPGGFIEGLLDVDLPL